MGQENRHWSSGKGKDGQWRCRDMEWERKGGFFWRRRGQTGPLKTDPFLPLWLPQGNPSPTHTPATTVYIAQRLERENICMYFFTLNCTSTDQKWGRIRHFYSIKCKCNSREEKREKDLNRLYSWDLSFSLTFGCPSGVKSRQENSLTGVCTQIFLSVHVNGTVNVSITWIVPL